jgi:formylglycine-generating enzyme required for sulfatase activity
MCRQLGQKTQRRFRLPTEVEWEYACRAGTTTPFFFGDTITTDQANYDGRYIYGYGHPLGVFRGQTTPVGSFPPNAWGLSDMHGNIAEWSRDWDGDNREQELADAEAPAGFAPRLRGGSWDNSPKWCRSASRTRSTFGVRSSRIGCRVCLGPD